jgi:hypothetical protein
VSYYEEARRVADLFGCRVGIYSTGNDGPGRHWEWKAESKDGVLAPGYADIVHPSEQQGVR